MIRTVAVTLLLSVAGEVAAQTFPDVILQPLVSGLTQPVAIKDAPDERDALYIVQQDGMIRVFDSGALRAQAMLDLRPRVSRSFEQGLLGLAFHPRYLENGYAFVNYTNAAGDTVVSRFRRSTGDPFVLDPASEAVILVVDQPFANHNGGDLHFGPDGYLYIALGDGGAGGDPFNNGQRLDTLLGKILRIDVDSAVPYAIPSTNPFVEVEGARGEIWALGLRNPWRISFDRETGDMWVADVGQDEWEEVNFQPAGVGGLNYGWRMMEGAHCYNPATGCENPQFTLPVAEYTHADGCSVTGGYRYRGTKYPRMKGVYLYGDFCSGTIWAAVPRGSLWEAQIVLQSGMTIATFGEDARGELYVASHAGTVYRIIDQRPQRIRAIR